MLAGIVSPTTPFIGEQPNKNISLCVYADETGLRTWNYKGDPMPIKTINMAGLQKWEETEDYIIYLDKDAVMTTVANYVTGTYDLFKERKTDIDGSMELLKINNIEWTSEDDSKLILDINDSMLEAIENTPTQLDEDEQVVQTFTSKAVPTTYECCFRVDKKSGEIYIGEGYENLVKFNNRDSGLPDITADCNLNEKTLMINFGKTEGGNKWAGVESILKTDNNFYFSYVSDKQIGFSAFVNYSDTDIMLNRIDVKIGFNYAFVSKNSTDRTLQFVADRSPADTILSIKNMQITKTSTPKPFVKSIMPSGKLAFVTSVTDTTRTFLNKGDGVVTFGNGYFSLKGEKIQQLLVYKGLLTQAEKDAELAKNIRLNDGYNEYFNIRREV